MLLRMVTCLPGAAGGPACALRMLASGNAPSEARLPATRPERRRKARRSRPPSARPCSALASAPRRTWRCVRLINMGGLSFRWIAIDAIIGLDVGRIRIVSRLALFLVGLGVGARFTGQRHGGGRSASAAERAQEFTPTWHLHASCFHTLAPAFAPALCNGRPRRE